ncbi:unnamed protein product, partial [marine sediment metagenome]
APAVPEAGQLAAKLRVSPLLAQLLINRRITTSAGGEAFLNPKLSDLIEPEQMPGIAEALERITTAIEAKEKITIYGDYDVDGITGVAILWHMLKLLGADVDYYIPHRIDEGYGLNIDAIKAIADNGTKLLITVDCGISAFDSARLAESLGLDLIITDHHRCSNQLPMAFAIVHPGIDPSYGNPDSAGAMVAFKLAWAAANKFKKGTKLDAKLRQFLIDATMFAGLGSIADIVPLQGENRVIA